MLLLKYLPDEVIRNIYKNYVMPIIFNDLILYINDINIKKYKLWRQFCFENRYKRTDLGTSAERIIRSNNRYCVYCHKILFVSKYHRANRKYTYNCHKACRRVYLQDEKLSHAQNDY
jgi:hypothetical protein